MIKQFENASAVMKAGIIHQMAKDGWKSKYIDQVNTIEQLFGKPKETRVEIECLKKGNVIIPVKYLMWEYGVNSG